MENTYYFLCLEKIRSEKYRLVFLVFIKEFYQPLQILKLKKKSYNKQTPKHMLKKILATYLSIVTISRTEHNKNMLNIFMHQTITKIIDRRKERRKTEYLLHELALLRKEYFRIQRNMFTSLKPIILYLQKRSS